MLVSPAVIEGGVIPRPDDDVQIGPLNHHPLSGLDVPFKEDQDHSRLWWEIIPEN